MVNGESTKDIDTNFKPARLSRWRFLGIKTVGLGFAMFFFLRLEFYLVVTNKSWCGV